MLTIDVFSSEQTEWASRIFRPQNRRKSSISRRLTQAERNGDPKFVPKSHMDECIDLLRNASIISKLDARKGYWQVETANDYRDDSTFTSHHGLFWFTVMPSQLKHSPGTFQRSLYGLFTNVSEQFALVYLDDIVITLHTPEEHIDHVRQVLILLHDDGVPLT